jgi:hypothetical protein
MLLAAGLQCLDVTDFMCGLRWHKERLRVAFVFVATVKGALANHCKMWGTYARNCESVFFS